MKRQDALFILLQWGVLLCMLAACSLSSSQLAHPVSPTKQAISTTPAKSSPRTVAMPGTLTSCPASGSGRAMVMAPLATGTQQNIVYVDNEQNSATAKPASGSLYRYDVATKAKTLIVQMPAVAIENAQVSRDGQWVLFTTMNGIHADVTQYTLNVVRMDGQGLQTLYCQVSPLSVAQWSLDQKNVMLYGCQAPGSQQLKICLLNVTSGKLQTEFTANGPLANGIVLRTWLDNTHIYLSNLYASRLPDTLYMLDTTKGPEQTYKDLIPVIQSGSGGRAAIADVDSSYDLTHIFVCYDTGNLIYQAPGQISELPALGGKERLIFASPHYAIIQVRAVTPHELLFIISNLALSTGAADSSHNGLWLIHTDGSGLMRLTTDSATQLSEFSHGSQYVWSNVSRDGTMYALERLDTQRGTYVLSSGSLSGGPPTIFASVGYELEIAGWTTM